MKCAGGGREIVPRNVPRGTILGEWGGLGAASWKWLVLLELELRSFMAICACCSEWGFWRVFGEEGRSGAVVAELRQ